MHLIISYLRLKNLQFGSCGAIFGVRLFEKIKIAVVLLAFKLLIKKDAQIRLLRPIENYSQLWQAEKAFRISKTDLRIRPVYHRLKNRIEAHICICFATYTVYKELERLLRQYKIGISAEKATEEIKEIRQLKYVLPNSRQLKTKILKPTEKKNTSNSTLTD